MNSDKSIINEACSSLWVSGDVSSTAVELLRSAEKHFDLSRCKRECVAGAAIVIASALNKQRVLSSEVSRVLDVSPASVRKH